MSRIVFLGTPESAVPTLERLDRSHDVGLVVTRPDRPRGRSAKPKPPPVKTAAERIGLEVTQPTSTRQLHESIESAGTFDVGVVVAYGRILTPDVLAIPGHGYLNVHFSLLPRWRGAAPISRALMAGDMMTGVTIIKLDEGLDTGPVLTAQAVDVGREENAGELTARLAELGAALLGNTMGPYLDDSLAPVPQSDEGATYAQKIEAADRLLTSKDRARDWVNRVRGLSPSPAALLEIDGVSHKILSAQLGEVSVEPGTWRASGGRLAVGTGDGSVEITHLQPSGKSPMTGEAWLRGRRAERGVIG